MRRSICREGDRAWRRWGTSGTHCGACWTRSTNRWSLTTLLLISPNRRGICSPLFARVIEGIAEPEGQLSTLATVADEIRSYLRSHEIGYETAPGMSQPPVIPDERVEALRRQLPSPITKRNSGCKTHGRWIGPDGVARTVVSGKDADSRLVDDQLERLDMPGRAARAGDVEMKLAAHMAENGIRHATVIINYQPCKGRFGCDTLVPILLPEGATLTVHGVAPDGTRFRKRYTGGARPWWR